MDGQNNPQQPMPQQPVMTPAQAPRSHILVMVLIGLVMLGVGLGGGYLLFANKSQSNQIPIQNPQPTVQAIPDKTNIQISPTTTASAKNTTVCTNNEMKISLILPKDWTCKTENLAKETGAMTIKSSIFTIEIGNLGRGTYCGGAGNDPTCKVSEFYTSEKINLMLYTSNGIDGEIFGEIKSPVRPFMAIKYVGMDKRKLTLSEKSELIQVINSITTN